MAGDRYRLLDLLVDIPGQRVERDGRVLDLGGLSFQLLAYLLAQGQRVVSFDELIGQVWSPAVVNEETVTQRVRLLRQSLGDDARRPRYIRSVRGQGYQLGAAPVPAEEPVRIRTHMPWPAVLAAVVLVLGTGLAWHVVRTPRDAPRTAAQELLDRAAWYAGMGQRDNDERAIALYERALVDAPDDSRALLGLSRRYSARTCLYNAGYEWAGRAQMLAERVLRASPNDPQAWSAVGYARDCEGDLPGAIAGYERAVLLDPTDDASRASAAYLYQEQGRLADALRANLDMRGDPSKVRFRDIAVARELELMGFTDAAEARFRRSFLLTPDNVFANIGWPAFLFAHARPDEARAAVAEAQAHGTKRTELAQLAGELALVRGDRAAATVAFAEAKALRPDAGMPATLAALYAETPPSPEWIDERIAQVRARLVDNAWPPARLELAVLAIARGDRRTAIAAIQGAVDAGYRDAAYLRTTPLLANLRGEAGFEAALAAIERRVTAERQRVLDAPWCPPELKATL
ncbi:DNA-binding winged helix-turn-helix (wHTH) protein [Luteibacter rhizovicinus]|uniref:DNA-binding winged helix-turn-helix (WHTH) protein n=1 Tax=Luteibacter rhizovicinus TaxID=242606 RepID=A0A4R3YV36_9GAMM|nr:winged helix-turn-helix transcriptional regulator [Luteibacter rhizovicinus]TCV96481.1 DNA-binding winged helix-turn-helix (wHTH) protein [Luteibacter rhizovicinus]